MRLCCAAILFACLLTLGCASSSLRVGRSSARIASVPSKALKGDGLAISRAQMPKGSTIEIAQVGFNQDRPGAANGPGESVSRIGIEELGGLKLDNDGASDNDASDNAQLDSPGKVKDSTPPVASNSLDTDVSAGMSGSTVYTAGEVALASIEQLAFAANPAVQQLSAQLEAANGKFTQAGLPPNPTAGIRGSDIFEEGASGRYGVYYGREVVRGNKLGVAQSVVCAEMKVLQQQLSVMQLKLTTDVRRGFYEVLVAQEKVQLADQLVEISQNAVEVSNQLFEAEEVAKTAVLQSRLELGNAKVTKLRADNQQLAARRKLAALIGEPDLPAPRVAGGVREMIELDDFELWYDELLNNSPEIAALFADVERASRELDRQRVKPIPNVTWQTSIDYDTVSDNFIGGFQIGMPIPTSDRNQGAIYDAQYQVVAAQRKAEKKALDLRQRLATAFESYLDAKLQIDAYESEIIPNARETLELFLEGYKQGETDVLQLLTVQRTYFQTNLAYLESLRQMWQQSVEVRGMLLKDSLN